MRRLVWILVIPSCIFLSGCSAKPLDDEEDNGKDNGEKRERWVSGCITNSVTGQGIAGVKVTDGFTFVATDAEGKYRIKRNSVSAKVYYTTPEDYEINMDPDTHVPMFYSPGRMDEKSEYVFDFKLTPLASEEKHFTLIAVADPQCAKEKHVNRFKDETLADIAVTIAGLPDKNVYAVTLGDIVYDSNDMWPLMKSAMGNICVSGRYLPFFQCIGNHDHNGLAEVTDEMSDDRVESLATANFVDNFGPSDYSFDRKGVHFVVMDDIRVKSKGTTSNSNGYKWGSYSARFLDSQLKWLEQDLSLVEKRKSKSIVLCLHAPLSTFSNPEDVLSMMYTFGHAYVIAGHTHIAEYRFFGDNPGNLADVVSEHILATACGMWWKTNSDASGAPAGYNVYSFTDGVIDNWYMKGTHYDKDYQLALYDGSSIYPGAVTGPLNWYDEGQTIVDTDGNARTLYVQKQMKDCIIADVFASDKYSWTVELFRNGVKLGDFKKAPDSNMYNICYASYSYNNDKKNTGLFDDFSHRVWYYKPDVLPSAMEPGWEVVATQTIPGTTTKNIYRCSAFSSGVSY